VDAASGLVTAVAPGKATIIATAEGNKSGNVVVTVPAPVSGVSISPAGAKTLYLGDTHVVNAVIAPANAANQAVTWSSNSTTVAIVVGAGSTGPNAGSAATITAVGEGSATINVTTADGGYTASITVTVDLTAEQRQSLAAANTILEKLGDNNASVQGLTVTVKGNANVTTTADIEVAAGVTLVVPAGATLTVNGTLSGAGTITVGGYVDAANSTFAGAANLANESKSRGIIAQPNKAFSDWVWTMYNRTWSDVIHVPACKKSDFALSYDNADCASATADDGTVRYYYNWKYVDVNKNTLCPAGWRVPTHADILEIPAWSVPVVEALHGIWGQGGYFSEHGTGLAEVDTRLIFWTSTEGDPAENPAFLPETTAYGIDAGPETWGLVNNNAFDKKRGMEVRCVRN
jgi:hypothetical protein